MGLGGQPRAIIFHTKYGREHCHVVWSRVRIAMEDKIAESQDDRVPITVETTITKDDMDEFLQSVVTPDLGDFSVATRVIHTLLVLGVWKEIARARR